jgi:hypothetical protein
LTLKIKLRAMLASLNLLSYLPTTTARSPLMVPGSDFCGSVAPISFLPYFITPSPSHTYQKKIKKSMNEQTDVSKKRSLASPPKFSAEAVVQAQKQY